MRTLIREIKLVRAGERMCSLDLRAIDGGGYSLTVDRGAGEAPQIEDYDGVSLRVVCGFYQAHLDTLVGEGWVVARDRTAEPVDPLDDLFAWPFLCDLQRGRGIRAAMTKAMRDVAPDIRNDAARVLALGPRNSLRIEGVDAFDFPFALHFAILGYVRLMRNGLLLNPTVLTALANQSRGRARTLLAALGHVDPMTRDFRAAIGRDHAALAL